VILVVEDDQDVREALCDVLEAEGYRTVAARNGLEAMTTLRAAVADTTVCLILLDLMMPVMSGFEFRERQRADPELARVPVAVMSARWDAQPELAGIEFLRKPMRVQDVLAVVRRHCARDDAGSASSR
jgi:CheY-like chemotaxis protein